MSTCMGGQAPFNCPPIACPGCTFIQASGKAQLCPVCNGAGTVPDVAGWDENGTSATSGTETRICHGCDGKGWVTV